MVDSSFYSQKILANQLKGNFTLFNALDINNNTFGASVGLENDHDMFLWNVIFKGTDGTIYDVREKKVYLLEWLLQVPTKVPT